MVVKKRRKSFRSLCDCFGGCRKRAEVGQIKLMAVQSVGFAQPTTRRHVERVCNALSLGLGAGAEQDQLELGLSGVWNME